MFIVVITITLSYVIYRFVKKSSNNGQLQLIALLPILIMGLIVYPALYPNEDFYRDEFSEVSGLKLPERAEFKFKTASYPDHFGDYASAIVIKVDSSFYNKLPINLSKRGLEENGHKTDSYELDRAFKYTEHLKIKKEYSKIADNGLYYYVGLLTDNETIIVGKLSW